MNFKKLSPNFPTRNLASALYTRKSDQSPKFKNKYQLKNNTLTLTVSTQPTPSRPNPNYNPCKTSNSSLSFSNVVKVMK